MQQSVGYLGCSRAVVLKEALLQYLAEQGMGTLLKKLLIANMIQIYRAIAGLANPNLTELGTAQPQLV